MHPPGPGLLRVCTKSYKIPDSDITLDTGTEVLIPVYSLHNDAQYYPEPEIFDPQRFTEENKASRPNGTFLPFGDGPRICIGKICSSISKAILFYTWTKRPRTLFIVFFLFDVNIGLRFAMMEAKTGLTEIITKFQILPCSDTQIPIKLNPRAFLLTPNEPIRLLFKKL